MASIFKRHGSGPWIITYFDAIGRRREKSSRTTDRKVAERIAAKLEGDAALRREGVIDPSTDRFREADARPIAGHVHDYLEQCTAAGQASRHLICKKAFLTKLIEGINAARLSDLSPARVTSHLHELKKSGKAARTVNACRSTILAFMQWCWKQERVAENRLGIVARFDEGRDKRRQRRALTIQEVQRLLKVTRDHRDVTGGRWVPRDAFYCVALLTGLRRTELKGLTWGDVFLEQALLIVRAEVSKAKREDQLPLHPQAVQTLRTIKPEGAKPSDAVFPTVPTIRTIYQDFARAGIQQRDEQGRVVDLHALRTTLATELARRGVAPQLAQRLLRHRDPRTTLTHYTALAWQDAAAAVEKIPDLGEPKKDAAGGESASRRLMAHDPQQIPQQSERVSAPNDATPCENGGTESPNDDRSKPLPSTKKRDKMRSAATQR